MQHTYFYAEAKWKAKGTYWDASGQPIDASGEVEISHEEQLWFLDGFMDVKAPGKDAVRIKNNYEIVAPKQGDKVVLWRSHNPALGWFKGFFTVIGDTILSSAVTEDGVYRNTESLLQVSEKLYENRGCLLKGDQLVSTWSMKIEKL